MFKVKNKDTRTTPMNDDYLKTVFLKEKAK